MQFLSKEEERESLRAYWERERRFSLAMVSAAAAAPAQGLVLDHCVVQEQARRIQNR